MVILLLLAGIVLILVSTSGDKVPIVSAPYVEPEISITPVAKEPEVIKEPLPVGVTPDKIAWLASNKPTVSTFIKPRGTSLLS